MKSFLSFLSVGALLYTSLLSAQVVGTGVPPKNKTFVSREKGDIDGGTPSPLSGCEMSANHNEITCAEWVYVRSRKVNGNLRSLKKEIDLKNLYERSRSRGANQ